MTATAETLVDVVHGEIIAGPSTAVARDVVIDSRLAGPGCLFVALPGERVDGHDYCLTALERGARVLIVSRVGQALDAVAEAAALHGAAIIRVSDPLRAIQDLASYHRSRLHCPVVGITGSTGKTTTKDFIDAVLATSMSIVSTEGNRNNELGVPLTVLRADSATEVLVVEMGMRGQGQIAELAAIARPTVAVITNVGTSHVEVLGTQEAIASAKAEVVHALEPNGIAFLNGDDAYSERIAAHSPAPVRLYGLGQHCAVRAEDVTVDERSCASFRLVADGGTVDVTLPVPGRHNVYNALAAAGVALHLGVSLENVSEGLAAVRLTAMRMQLFSSASGVTVINDAYNAHPVSMRAAVDTLAEMCTEARRVAVLGDMAELGSLTELAHFQLGEHVARAGVDELVTVGPRAVRIAEGARAAGMPADRVRPCKETPEAIEVLDDLLETGDLVLVKASRVMGLEAVVEGIVNPR